MSMIRDFNRTMDYIETVLDDEVDANEIARYSGYSVAMFGRLFSILTGLTLSEYIRHRRMTEAADALRDTDEKVIDIALRYGYDSPDAFGAAFKKFHGASPSEVKKGAPRRVVTRIRLSLGIKGGESMEISLQKKPAISVAGIKMEGIDNALCPLAWEKLYATCTEDALTSLGNGQSYGVCYDSEGFDRINYMAAYDTADKAAAEAMKLSVMEIQANEYAVVKLKGSVPGCIHAGWKYLMEVFFPEHRYRHSGAPDFEVYEAGDMTKPSYQMELWVPVAKEK